MFIIFQHKLKGAQRDKVRHFIQITNAPEKVAVRLLNQHDWKLELAIDDFYFCPELTSNASNHQERRVTVDRRKVEQLFNKYRGEFLPNTSLFAVHFTHFTLFNLYFSSHCVFISFLSCHGFVNICESNAVSIYEFLQCNFKFTMIFILLVLSLRYNLLLCILLLCLP